MNVFANRDILNTVLYNSSRVGYCHIASMVNCHLNFHTCGIRQGRALPGEPGQFHLWPVNNFLGQVIGNASEGKYNTVNNSSSGEVTF